MKRSASVLLICCCVISSCHMGSGPAPAAVRNDSTQLRNKQTVMRSLAALNKHDVNGVFADCAPGFVGYDPEGRLIGNIDSIKAGMSAWLRALPDFKGDHFTIVADSNKVVAIGDWTGTFTNALDGIKPTGKLFRLKDADVFTFDSEGRMLSYTSIQSEAAQLYQLGIPLPPRK